MTDRRLIDLVRSCDIAIAQYLEGTIERPAVILHVPGRKEAGRGYRLWKGGPRGKIVKSSRDMGDGKRHFSVLFNAHKLKAATMEHIELQAREAHRLRLGLDLAPTMGMAVSVPAEKRTDG